MHLQGHWRYTHVGLGRLVLYIVHINRMLECQLQSLSPVVGVHADLAAAAAAAAAPQRHTNR